MNLQGEVGGCTREGRKTDRQSGRLTHYCRAVFFRSFVSVFATGSSIVMLGFKNVFGDLIWQVVFRKLWAVSIKIALSAINEGC